jgi:hypothetical protein
MSKSDSIWSNKFREGLLGLDEKIVFYKNLIVYTKNSRFLRNILKLFMPEQTIY